MTPDQLRAARQIVEITAVMAHFNVVVRQAAPLVDAALDGAVFVPWQPVSLSTPGAPTDTSGPEAVRNVPHLRENLDAQDIKLSPEDIQLINNIAPEHTAAQSLPTTPQPQSR